jgi:hypothetical protein
VKDGRPDAIGVVDVDPDSKSYGRLIGQTDMSHAGDELYHFGWNACSSCLCPYAPHPHMERRHLVVPGINSSRIHILDTRLDPRQPKIVKAIKKVIEIPAEPADPEKLPPILQGFKAVAPLVTDINLSIDDRYLYVSCLGTGEFIQYGVRDPFKPKKVAPSDSAALSDARHIPANRGKC